MEFLSKTLFAKKSHKVVFCGIGHFESSYLFTKEALKDDDRISIVQCAADKIEKDIIDADIIIPLMMRVTDNLLKKAPKLKMIMQFGVGIEGIDIPAATNRKIHVCSIPSANCSNDKSSAEHAIYLALAVSRDQKAMQNSLLTGRLGFPTGRSLFGANALIYGFGGIGRQVANRLSSFDMQVSAVTRTLPPLGEVFPSQEHLTELGSIAEYPLLASNADILFLCCSQNSENMGMVDRAFLSHLKPGAVLINVARGGLLNYADVLEALESSHLFGVGIDVYHTEPFPSPIDDPFLFHPRVVATPHVAGVTQISYRNMAQLVAENVRRVIAGLIPIGNVNSFENDVPFSAIDHNKESTEERHIGDHHLGHMMSHNEETTEDTTNHPHLSNMRDHNKESSGEENRRH